MSAAWLPAFLTWAAPGVPLAVAAAWLVPPLRRAVVGLAPVAALPALLLALVHLAEPGAAAPVEAPVLFLGLRLGVDLAGGALLALTALLWTAAGAFAWCQHRNDPGRERLFAFWSATLAGNMGLVLAWDLLSFYLAFAVMTFAAWGLVVHHRTEAAIRAGRVYIVLALVGEVAILSALFALGAAGGGGVFLGFELSEAWIALGGWGPLVAALAVAGFGVKAGLVPLHPWLPLAHPVAPTAASALLSGVMVKAGVLGWLRILPAGSELPLHGVGEGLLVLGVVGAFWGVIAGLAQDDPKTVLAYSTVSQMGYLAIGVGLLVLLPDAAPLALGAVLLYALHHGMAKAALFLSVGVAGALSVAGAEERNGMGPTGWILAVGVAIPALALAGAPLTSGVVAKGALKEALGELGGGWYAVLDPLLLVAAFGTALLLVRFWLVLQAKLQAPVAAPRAGVPAGLMVPWAFVVAGVAAGPLWMAGAIPLPEGIGVPVAWSLDAPGSALLPLVLAGIVALGVVGGRLLPRWIRELHIPAGDLVVPLERLMDGRPPGVGRLARLAQASARAVEVAEAAVVRRYERLERGDLLLVRGPALALALFGLVALLAVALLRG